MVRRTILAALMLGVLCLPLQAEPTAPTAPPIPQVRIAIAFALVTDPDLKISRVLPRLVSINQLIVSHRPWGEARLEHLDLQIVSGEDALRLLAALAKGQRFANATTNIVPSGGQENVVHCQQVGTLALDQETNALPNSPAANVPTSLPQPIMQALRFFLRPKVNPDGTVTLSFAPSHLETGPILTPMALSAASNTLSKELDDQEYSFTELGTIRSGGTLAITELLDGPHLNTGPRLTGVELVAFVTPTIE